MNWEFPDVQAGFREGRRIRDQITNIHCILEKARKFQKNIYFWFVTTLKHLTVWITTNNGKFLKQGNARPTVSWETHMQVNLEPNTEKQTGS